MSFLGGLFGGSSGAGFTPQNAPITAATNTDQLNTTWFGAQNGLQQQQQFVNALNAQNGVQNQSNVYNQLQGVANGTGANPAQAMLNQATGQNVANQAALMASQRGSGANVGLLARQAAMQGANTQQQAVGQAANLQANQSLNALGQLGSLATNQVGQQANALTGLNQGQQSEQANVMGALQGQNNAVVNTVDNQNSSKAQVASGNASAQGSLFGGLLGGVGAGLLMASKGGLIPRYADGGSVDGPQSAAGKFLQGWSGANAQKPSQQLGSLMGSNNPSMTMNTGGNLAGQALGQGIANAFSSPVPPAEQGINITSNAPSLGGGWGVENLTPAPFLAQGGMPMVQGGPVPGQAQVKDNSVKNDTVPAMLSPGEIVIPRSITQHPDAAKLAADFVAKTLAEHKKKSGNFDDGGQQGDSDQAQQPVVNINLGGDSVSRAPASATPMMSPQEAAAAQASAPPAKPYSVSDMFVPSGQDVGNAVSSMGAAAMGLPGAGQQAPQPAAVAPQTPQAPKAPAPQMPTDPYGFDAYSKNLNKGIGEEKAGLFGEAKARGQEGDEASQALIASQAQQKANMDAYQEHYNTLDKERQGWMQDIQNQKIDPNRYMSNMGTGQKISTALGLILGGMGGGLTHQANPALAYLNEQIGRDVEGQKLQLGQKENLLSANMKQFGNMKDATDMTRVMLNDAASMQLKQIAQKYQGKVESSRALASAGKIDADNAQAISTIAARRAATQGMGAGQALPASLDPALDRRVEIAGPSGQPAVLHAPDKDTADKVRPQLQALDELQSAAARVDAFNKTNGTTYLRSQNAGTAASLNREMDAAIAHAQASGGQIGRLVDKFEDMRPSAGAFFQNYQKGKLEGMNNFVAAQKAALIRNNLNSGPAFGK